MKTCHVTPQTSLCHLYPHLGCSFIINVERSGVSWYGPSRRVIFIPYGTGPFSLPKSSPNLYKRGVAVSMMHVGTTDSVSSTPPVNLMVSLLASTNMPQYPPTRPLLYGMYPLSVNFSPSLSESVTHAGCGMLGGGGPLSYQSA